MRNTPRKPKLAALPSYPRSLGQEGQRVEVIDRSGNKRRFYVGKSTGWLPIHLKFLASTAMGGPATHG